MVEVKKEEKLDFTLNDLLFGISLGEGAFGNVRVGWSKNKKHV